MAQENDPGTAGASAFDDPTPRASYRAQLKRLHESGTLGDSGYEHRSADIDKAATWGDLETAISGLDRGDLPVPTRRRQRRELPAEEAPTEDVSVDEDLVDDDGADDDLADDDEGLDDDEDLDDEDLEAEADEDLDDEDLDDEDDAADLTDEDPDDEADEDTEGEADEDTEGEELEDDEDLEDEDLDDDADEDLADEDPDEDEDLDEDDAAPSKTAARSRTSKAVATRKGSAAAARTTTSSRKGKQVAGKAERVKQGGKGRPTPKRPKAVETPDRTGPIQFIKESIEELRKVVYPTSNQLWTYFAVVLVVVVFVMGFTSAFDFGFGQLVLLVFG